MLCYISTIISVALISTFTGWGAHLSCLPAHGPSCPGLWRCHWYLWCQPESSNIKRDGSCESHSQSCTHQGLHIRLLYVPPTAWWLTPSPGSASGLLQWGLQFESAPGNHCRDKRRWDYIHRNYDNDDEEEVGIPRERRHISKAVFRLSSLSKEI